MLHFFLPFIFGVLLLLQIYRSRTKTAHHLLPSPGFCFPILGHFHHLIKEKGRTDPVQHLWDLYRKHGKNGMLRIKALTTETLFIGDIKVLTEVYNNPNVQGRTTHSMFPILKEYYGGSQKGIPGIILSEGKTWVEQRRFALKTLRDFGFGKSGMDGAMAEELEKFSDYIESFEEQPMNVTDKFNMPTLNLLWSFVAGQQFEYDNQKFLTLLLKLTEVISYLDSPQNTILTSFPWMNKVGYLRKVLGRDYVMEISNEVRKMVAEAIEEHEETHSPSSPRDYIDVTLNKINETTDESSSFYGKVGKENLICALYDLFAAADTTSTALSWSILYITKYQDVQKKVQEEIQNVVGNERVPNLEDKPNMPYTEAVMWESFRMGNPGPYTFQHVTTKDLIVNGYTIPVDTLVMGMVTEMNKGDHLEDPFAFKPERFINSEGKFEKFEAFIPFSIGKRQCMGETMAKAQFFVMFAGLLQKFTFLPEDPANPPSEDYIPGIVSIPKPFKVIAKKNDLTRTPSRQTSRKLSRQASIKLERQASKILERKTSNQMSRRLSRTLSWVNQAH